MKKILVLSLLLIMATGAAVADVIYSQELYEKAVNGDAESQCKLGYCYENGLGVDQDYCQAVYWYQKSAEQGYALAQYNLGGYYEDGKGVTKDINQAVEWYRKAAKQGYEDAQKELNRLGYTW